MKNGLEEGETGSISQEIYFSAIDLARVLKLTDAEVAKLARSAVLVRVPNPQDSRAFLYPLLENVTRYVTHIRSARKKSYVNYIKEKSRTQTLQRKRAALELGIQEGRLVDKQELLQDLAPRMLKIRQAMEQALSAGVPRLTVERIVGIITDAIAGIKDGSELGANTKADCQS